MKAEADKVQIIVSDTGIGISPKEQKKLFTSFFRASNAISSGTPGIGLGLLQAKRFATLLKGDIKVNSIVNQGSEFMLILNKACSHSLRRAHRHSNHERFHYHRKHHTL